MFFWNETDRTNSVDVTGFIFTDFIWSILWKPSFSFPWSSLKKWIYDPDQIISENDSILCTLGESSKSQAAHALTSKSCRMLTEQRCWLGPMPGKCTDCMHGLYYCYFNILLLPVNFIKYWISTWYFHACICFDNILITSEPLLYAWTLKVTL